MIPDVSKTFIMHVPLKQEAQVLQTGHMLLNMLLSLVYIIYGVYWCIYDWQTFPVLCLTYSRWMTTYVGKPSAVGHPTRPTQPFILSRSTNE